MKKKNKISWRDITWLLLGMLLGMTLILLWLNAGMAIMLSNLRIEEVTIGINETRLVEGMIETLGLNKTDLLPNKNAGGLN